MLLFQCVLVLGFAANAADQLPLDARTEPPGAPTPSAPLLSLGVGDAIAIQVFGRPELSSTAYVSDDGSVQVPLAGRVQVAGLSPTDAGQRIGKALKDGRFLLDPHVTVSLTQGRSQQVSILGAVRQPGRYPIDGRTTVMDALALAGGVGETGSDAVVLIRADAKGEASRQDLDLKGLKDPSVPLPKLTLLGGDSIFVPPARQFYVYGEVQAPNMYRLENGMTVEQALSRSGGVTSRGSRKRVELRRRMADGQYETRRMELAELVRADDVIRVKERIF